MATQSKAPDRRDPGRVADIDAGACLSTPSIPLLPLSCQYIHALAELWGVDAWTLIQAFRAAAAADLQRQITQIDANIEALSREVPHAEPS